MTFTSLVSGYPHFRGICCPQLQDLEVGGRCYQNISNNLKKLLGVITQKTVILIFRAITVYITGFPPSRRWESAGVTSSTKVSGELYVRRWQWGRTWFYRF